MLLVYLYSRKINYLQQIVLLQRTQTKQTNIRTTFAARFIQFLLSSFELMT